MSDQSSKSCVSTTHRSTFLLPAKQQTCTPLQTWRQYQYQKSNHCLWNELSPAPPSETVHPDSQDQFTPSSPHLTRKQYIRLIVCAYAIFTLTGFAGMLLDLPLVRLLERAACQAYYLKYPQLSSPSSNAVTLCSNAIYETRCRTVPIKAELQLCLVVKTAFDVGVGL
jgi:hypothetical protein